MVTKLEGEGREILSIIACAVLALYLSVFFLMCKFLFGFKEIRFFKYQFDGGP